MADGRPVVAARIGALPELIEHEATGLLAEPADAEAFATLTRRALEDPAAARWSDEARRRIAQACDPRRHVEGLLAIYREAMAR
jgi:glycosyltransferase involved in cell wall biosynthesis